MKNNNEKKKKIVKFIEQNIVEKVINSNIASKDDIKRANKVKRDINNKKLTYMSIIVYYYHSIINRKDVGADKKNKMLETFEKNMKKFEKVLKEVE